MADYAGVLADLRTKRESLERERVELDKVIEGIQRILAGQASPVALTPDLRHGRRTAAAEMTMPKALTQILGGASQPQTTRQVVEDVKRSGMKVSANVRGHVYNTLHRLSQGEGPFQRHDDGRWSLRG